MLIVDGWSNMNRASTRKNSGLSSTHHPCWSISIKGLRFSLATLISQDCWAHHRGWGGGGGFAVLAKSKVLYETKKMRLTSLKKIRTNILHCSELCYIALNCLVNHRCGYHLSGRSSDRIEYINWNCMQGDKTTSAPRTHFLLGYCLAKWTMMLLIMD
jgi:hypothetical protein